MIPVSSRLSVANESPPALLLVMRIFFHRRKGGSSPVQGPSVVLLVGGSLWAKLCCHLRYRDTINVNEDVR